MLELNTPADGVVAETDAEGFVPALEVGLVILVAKPAKGEAGRADIEAAGLPPKIPPLAEDAGTELNIPPPTPNRDLAAVPLSRPVANDLVGAVVACLSTLVDVVVLGVTMGFTDNTEDGVVSFDRAGGVTSLRLAAGLGSFDTLGLSTEGFGAVKENPEPDEEKGILGAGLVEDPSLPKPDEVLEVKEKDELAAVEGVADDPPSCPPVLPLDNIFRKISLDNPPALPLPADTGVITDVVLPLLLKLAGGCLIAWIVLPKFDNGWLPVGFKSKAANPDGFPASMSFTGDIASNWRVFW